MASSGDITIKREETGGRGRYVSVVDGHESELTFTRRSQGEREVLVINHTGVPVELSGHGVGLALLARVVEDARKEGFGIVPNCSFARVIMQRHTEWSDVLAAAE